MFTKVIIKSIHFHCWISFGPRPCLIPEEALKSLVQPPSSCSRPPQAGSLASSLPPVLIPVPWRCNASMLPLLTQCDDTVHRRVPGWGTHEYPGRNVRGTQIQEEILGKSNRPTYGIHCQMMRLLTDTCTFEASSLEIRYDEGGRCMRSNPYLSIVTRYRLISPN